MCLFIEKGLRRGISYIAKRCSKVNNKYMKNYYFTKPSVFIKYQVEKDLYDWAMSGYLPYDEFKWLKDVDNFDVNSISENSPTGYILEVDLEYANELHELHNDYPFYPEKLPISDDMLSDCSEKNGDKYGINIGDVKQLVPHSGNKLCS